MNKTISDDSCECFCSSDQVYTILSILGFVIPLLISEILPLSECEANGLLDGLIKLIKKSRKITPVKN
jgi:hypothetical protein